MVKLRAPEIRVTKYDVALFQTKYAIYNSKICFHIDTLYILIIVVKIKLFIFRYLFLYHPNVK